MIQLKHVSKTLAKNEVLKDISVKFEEGGCYLVSGPNGSGKTMLLRMVCGLVKPTSGEVCGVDGKSLGVIIENPEFFKYETVLYNLKYLANIQKKISGSEIDKWIKLFDLEEQKNMRVSKLSLGMKQRLALCQAFMENPDIILLDEPFNALDAKSQAALIAIINSEKADGKIIIVAAHNVSAELNGIFDCEIKMENGFIVNT